MLTGRYSRIAASYSLAGLVLCVPLLVGGCSQPEKSTASPTPAASSTTGGTTGGTPTDRPTGTPVGRPGMAGVPGN